MKWAFLLFPILLGLSCRAESLFNRLSEDYLPYDKINSNWVYRVTGPDTLTVEWTVKDQEALRGKQANRIESTQGDFYYAVESGSLLEYVTRTVFSFGEELVLEERWRQKVQGPLNLGNRWEDSYQNQIIQSGVTYAIESSLEGVVEAIETVITPVDFFDQCYRVSYDIHSRVTSPTGEVQEESIHMLEWYAPGVGMVKREVDGGENWDLLDYQVL